VIVIYSFFISGSAQAHMLDVSAASLSELSAEMSVSRHIVGRRGPVDGDDGNYAVLIPVNKIQLVVEQL
jgi:hypothetical protein